MNIFQSKEWEKFKLATGYSQSYWIDNILVLQKKLPLNKSMLYSPMVSKDQIIKCGMKDKKFTENIEKIAKENNAIFYRLELDIPIATCDLQPADFGFIKSFEEMQPSRTLILDTNRSDEEILKEMKPKGRYNIKIASKHGVKIRKTRNLENFFRLYKETAKRQKISYRNSSYFKKMIDILEPKGYCEVFEAYISSKNNEQTNYYSQSTTDQVLAVAIIIFYKGEATYLFGASSSEMRNVMAPYALHWEIIKEARDRRCNRYDLFGIAPDDQPHHRWSGVTRFKKQFGGQEITKMGSWDKVFKPIEYQTFKIFEKLRRK